MYDRSAPRSPRLGWSAALAFGFVHLAGACGGAPSGDGAGRAGGAPLGAAAVEPEPPPGVLPDRASLPVDSDAVAPRWMPRPVPLVGGAVLVDEGGTIAVHDGEAVFRVAIGAPLWPPARSEDGRRVALSATVGDGPASALLLIERGPEGWSSRTLIKGLHPVDRVAITPAGDQLAFVWAGAEGGVAAVYRLALPEGAPERLTSRAPYVPGQPPADFVPLPLAAAPRFEAGGLVWRSELGEHRVELSQ